MNWMRCFEDCIKVKFWFSVNFEFVDKVMGNFVGVEW